MDGVKKIFGILTIMLLVIGIGTDAIKASEKEENHTEYNDILRYVPANGSERFTDMLSTEDGNNLGAMNIRAFKVLEDGRIMILNARQEKILVFKNSALEKEIDISFCIDPQYFTYENGTYIIFDLTSFGNLYYVAEDGKVIKNIKLPEEIISSTIAGFYSMGKENYLITYDKELIQFPDFKKLGFLFDVSTEGDVYSVRFGENEWKLPYRDGQFFNPVYVDEKGCLYIEETTLAEGTEYIQGETYLLKLDSKNDEIMSMRLRLEDYKDFPDQYYDFCAGNLFVLELFGTECQVSKVTMSEKREASRIAEMEEKNKAESVSYLNEMSTNAIVVSRTRQQVASEAYSVVYAGWQINEGNKTIVSWAILPKYIDEAAIGTTVVGVPYCWGGYNTPVTAILGKLVSGSMAGNVNTEKPAVTGPVGFDCSGFVSYCYGLGEHIATKDLDKSVSLTPVDSKEMQSMDMILKTGHVMLFREYSGNYINIYESTTEGEQKARAHSYTLNFIFTTKKYKAYTPW